MVVSQVVRRGLRYEVHPLMSQALHRPVAELGGETDNYSVRVPEGDNKNMPPYFTSTALIDSCYE
jgi:hypothetical protein